MIKEKLPHWQLMSTNVGRLFASHLPFAPYSYTIMSGVMAILATIAAWQQAHLIALLLFFLAAWCDIIDGAVARAQNKASPLGAYIDGVMDRFVDFALLFSYFFCHIKTPWLDLGQWISIASFVVILPSFNVAYANHRKAVNDDHETLIWRIMNRGEMFVMMLGILAASLFSDILAGYLLLLLIVLSTITIFQTIIATIYHAQKHSH